MHVHVAGYQFCFQARKVLFLKDKRATCTHTGTLDCNSLRLLGTKFDMSLNIL